MLFDGLSAVLLFLWFVQDIEKGEQLLILTWESSMILSELIFATSSPYQIVIGRLQIACAGLQKHVMTSWFAELNVELNVFQLSILFLFSLQSLPMFLYF